MKYLIFSIALFLVVGCQSKHQKESAAATSDTNIKTWSGTINGKIPVSLWFTMNKADSVVYGELIYTNTKNHEPIILEGAYNGTYMLNEYLKNGNVTGAWEGKIINGSFTGKWQSMSSEKELTFNLSQRDTSIDSNMASITNPENIDGKYTYKYPSEAGGEINIKKYDKNHVIFNVSCITAAPAYNLAIMNDDTLILKDNKATYSTKDDEGKCEFTIYFYKNFITVDYSENTTDCGFGNGAGVEGTFIKISSTPEMGMDTH